MTALNDQQSDFKKIVAAINCGKYTPTQIGGLFRQYYVRHLKSLDVEEDLKVVAGHTDTDLSLFDGKLPDLDNS